MVELLERFERAAESERSAIATRLFEEPFPRDERFLPAFEHLTNTDLGIAIEAAYEHWPSPVVAKIVLAKVQESVDLLDPLDPPDFASLYDLCGAAGVELPSDVRGAILALLSHRIEEFRPIPGHPGSEEYLHDMLEVHAELEGPLLSDMLWERIQGWHRNWYRGTTWPPNAKCRCDSGLKFKRCCGNPAYPMPWLESRHRGGPFSRVGRAQLSELIIPSEMEILRDLYHPQVTDDEIRDRLLQRASLIRSGRKPEESALAWLNPHYAVLAARFRDDAEQCAFPLGADDEDDDATGAVVVAQDAYLDRLADAMGIDRDVMEFTFEDWLDERHRHRREGE